MALDSIILADSPVAYWKMDEASGNLVDSSGNSLTATASNLTYEAGSLLLDASGNSISFNGSSSKAEAAHNSVYDFAHTDSFTIEAVIEQASAGSTGTEQTIVSKMLSSSPFTGWDLALQSNGDGTADVIFAIINDFGGGNRLSVLTTNIPLTTTSTYHVLVVYNGDSSADIFINGFRAATSDTATISASAESSATLTVGSRQSSRFFNGQIQHAAVYDSALSYDRILARVYEVRNMISDPFEPAGGLQLTLDTDLDSDCDDYGDMGACHALWIQGDCAMNGVITSTSQEASAPVAKAINDYYSKPDLPIGAYMGDDLVDSGANFTSDVRDFYRSGDTRANYDSDLTIYRTILEAAANDSVVICMVGFAKPLADLLQSSADGISGSTGLQLVTDKVNRVVAVAGKLPNGGQEFNINNDPNSWDYVAQNCPVPLVWCGIELGDTITTRPPTSHDPQVNPIKMGYDEHSGIDARREAWGQLGVLYSVFGPSGRFVYASRGTGTVNTSLGRVEWAYGESGNHYYLRKQQSDSEFQTELETLLAVETSSIAIKRNYFNQMMSQA